MRFPRFWAKGKHGDFSCWGWSDISQGAAKSEGEATARKIAALFASGKPPKSKTYEYGKCPLREQILEEKRDKDGELALALTRNHYGALVLNCAKAMFIDIDLDPAPEKGTGSGSIFGGLFGGRKDMPKDPSAQAIENVESWSNKNPTWGLRLYRTAAGLRILVTHALFDPLEATSGTLFEELKADPLYRKLCQNQKCFRARLTPKPWRCGMSAPRVTWPWEDPKAEQTFRKWEEKYNKCSEKFATCLFLKQLGNSSIHTEIEPVIEMHDRISKSSSNRNLA